MPDLVINEIVSAVHVRHIRTPMSVAEPFTRDARVDEVAVHMDRVQHDVTPIFPEKGTSGFREQPDPDGTLRRVDLDGLDSSGDIRAAVQPLSGDVLIDSRANLLELLGRFQANHTFLIVVGSGGLDGMVTPSDMNKQAGRTHLFIHVSALELALAERLRTAKQSEERVLELISAERSARVRARLRKQEKSDQAADFVATLDFQDLLLIEREMGVSGLSQLLSNAQIEGLSEFRNRVMHSVLEPAGDAPERLDELLEGTQLVKTVLDAVADGSVGDGP